MLSTWDCGCSLIGEHICGKDKPENEPWALKSKDRLRVGDKVTCIKEFKNGPGPFDGDTGELVEIGLYGASQRYKVSFNQNYLTHIRWCFEVEKL